MIPRVERALPNSTIYEKRGVEPSSDAPFQKLWQVSKGGLLVTDNATIKFRQRFSENGSPEEIEVNSYDNKNNILWSAVIEDNQMVAEFDSYVDEQGENLGLSKGSTDEDCKEDAKKILKHVEEIAQMRIPNLAYENDEKLIIKSRGRMLKVGDAIDCLPCKMPESGQPTRNLVTVTDGVKILSFVNQFDTPVCDVQTNTLEKLGEWDPNFQIIGISKQPVEDLNQFSIKHGLQVQMLASIDDETATALGVALEPDEGASEGWNDMLLRSLVVLDKSNRVVYVEHVMDQMKEPNYEAALAAATAANTPQQ